MNSPRRHFPRTAHPLRGTLVLIGCVTALAFQVGHSALGATIPPQKALSVVESLESKFQVMQWTAVYGEAELADPEDSSSIAKPRTASHRTAVVFDPLGRRYRAELQGVARWADGAAPYNATCQGFSFDGEVFRSWERQKGGTELPTAQDDPGRGVISTDVNDQHLREELPDFAYLLTGLGYMPPCFSDFESTSRPLSHLLRKWIEEGRDVTIVEDEEGAWTITTPTTYAGQEGFLLRIGYDPSKGGVVTGAKWVYPGEEGDIENTRLDVELQEVSDGVWVPKTVSRVFTLDRPAIVKYVSYEDVKVNPPVDSNTFRLEFPNGVQVTDHIEKKYYVVGEIVDEQSAVREFMQRHNVTGDVPSAPSVLSFGRIAAVVAGVVLLLLFLIALRVRKRRAV